MSESYLDGVNSHLKLLTPIADYKPTPLEIVSAQGTIATSKNEFALHIHILVSDENHAVGGHLNEAKIFSTAQVVIAELNQQITRMFDDHTGLKELKN